MPKKASQGPLSGFIRKRGQRKPPAPKPQQTTRKKPPSPEELQQLVRESAKKMPFRSIVHACLGRFNKGQSYYHNALAIEVFNAMKRAGADHPAVVHMDLHHTYLTKGRGFEIRDWRNINWQELRNAAMAQQALEKDAPLRLIYNQLLNLIGQVLAELRGQGVVVAYAEPRKPQRFKILKEIPPVEE